MCHMNDDFIKHWESRYDEIAHDENDYQDLKHRVMKEIMSINTISSDTFLDIYKWKAQRAVGYVKWGSFHIYWNTFRDILQIHYNNNEQIMILIKLPGIGIPIASTSLHFVYPNAVAIVDFRTVEALQKLHCLHSIKSL